MFHCKLQVSINFGNGFAISILICKKKYSVHSNATTTTTDQVCDYVFGKGMCCSGILDNAASPMGKICV